MKFVIKLTAIALLLYLPNTSFAEDSLQQARQLANAGIDKQDTELIIRAIDIYKHYADGGNIKAKHLLGLLYLNWFNPLQDKNKGVSYLVDAGNQGSIDAQYTLGIVYSGSEEGSKFISIQSNNSEAEKWFLLAAKQGHSSAQYYLGTRYENGYSNDKDIVKALMWYRHSAEGGNVYSQERIGAAYLDATLDLQRSLPESKKWFLQAQEKGSMVAPKALKTISCMEQLSVSKELEPDAYSLCKRASEKEDLFELWFGMRCPGMPYQTKKEQDICFDKHTAPEPEMLFIKGLTYAFGYGRGRDLHQAYSLLSLAERYGRESDMINDYKKIIQPLISTNKSDEITK
ncbi:tetratricopeptide repeat protein [Aeromonas salmonicida]|uniref:tetratricopeptide repeat protein n=2 Tax=Aeromonas TaxID=642 RepID=UPI00073C3C99|nr:tetratricopeptide repeat protein [Aeromonas salmonicida]KTA78881.1 hypothetical protein VO69_20025 [Aeromonas salmonicida]MDE7529499.1 sel1 repeat family protein [Aeromonas salmonicida]MDE7533769.1 sel1 repeat family protein [Aeromonas salmonicida]